MEIIDILDLEFSKKLVSLKDETVFWGTINYIEKLSHSFIIHIDLFNQLTNEIDDNFLFNARIKNLTYSLDLVIEATTLSILGHSNEVYKFEVVQSINNYFDTFNGTISLLINHKFNKITPFNDETKFFKVTKLSLDDKMIFKKQMDEKLDYLNHFISFKEKYNIEVTNNTFNHKVGIKYSQYHVGLGNCSYINIGGISKGFFNIGFSKKKIGKTPPYLGFSRHKPDWIVLANLNKGSYNAAIRYGNHNTFSCVWIIPNVLKFNMNLIRLMYCIKNANGRIVMLKYKANSSVCSLVVDNIKMEVYYTTDYDMNINGLSLYIENENQFISSGNSDYNFLTKSLIRQTFDIIVMPYQGSKTKTKIHFNKDSEIKSKLFSYSNDIRLRNGFHIHRTDTSGNFFCKI